MSIFIGCVSLFVMIVFVVLIGRIKEINYGTHKESAVKE